MNKKIFTIILAAILALIAAVFTFQRQKQVETPIIQEQATQEETTEEVQSTAEPETVEMKTEKKPVLPKVKPAQKIKKAPKPVAKVAPQVLPKPKEEIIEAEVQKTEPIKEISVDLDKESGDVVVLKEIRSENYYKHKYTPARYKK